MRCVCAAVWMSGHRTAHGGMCGAPRRAYGVGCTALFCYIFSVCWLLLNAVVPFRFWRGGLYDLRECAARCGHERVLTDVRCVA